MNLPKLDETNKNELSMIEVAHAVLEQNKKPLSFAKLSNEIQNYLGENNENMRNRLVQFYTDLNTDGSFISLGNNNWGLRTWYPFDSIDEATMDGSDNDSFTSPSKDSNDTINAFDDVEDTDDVVNYDANEATKDDLDVDVDDDDDNFDGVESDILDEDSNEAEKSISEDKPNAKELEDIEKSSLTNKLDETEDKQKNSHDENPTDNNTGKKTGE